MIIQVILVAALAGALVLTWRRAKQDALSRLEAFLWSALWIAAAVVVLRPGVASSFASLVGVGRGADAVIYVSIIALFYLVFRIFLRLDKLDRDITLLVRKAGLAERDARRGGAQPKE